MTTDEVRADFYDLTDLLGEPALNVAIGRVHAHHPFEPNTESVHNGNVVKIEVMTEADSDDVVEALKIIARQAHPFFHTKNFRTEKITMKIILIAESYE